MGQNVDGILGYAPATAVQIMRNILLYSASSSPATPANVTPKPTAKPKAKPAGKAKPGATS